MDIYLVKRGHFKDNIILNDITGIDSIMNWDYMGSAEFEFGYPRKSLVRMLHDRELFTENVTINDKKFTIMIGSSKWSKENINSIVQLFTENISNHYQHLKEPLNFYSYFKGKTTKQLKRNCTHKMEVIDNYNYADFWWDIDNDWFLYPKEYDNKINLAITAMHLNNSLMNSKE